jgi:hypothetical protein
MRKPGKGDWISRFPVGVLTLSYVNGLFEAGIHAPLSHPETTGRDRVAISYDGCSLYDSYSSIKFIEPSSCSISLPSNELDHGSIKTGENNPRDATATLRVTCTNATRIRVNLRSKGAVDMKNPNIVSTINIDGGTNGSITTTVGPGGEVLTLRSRMTLTNPETGVFTGNTVVRVNIL